MQIKGTKLIECDIFPKDVDNINVICLYCTKQLGGCHVIKSVNRYRKNEDFDFYPEDENGLIW